MRVTIDTNVLPADDLIARASAAGLHVAVVMVTPREMTGSSFEIHLNGIAIVPETIVLDESPLGEAVLAAEDDPFEKVLSIVSGRTFPALGRRDTITSGQRRQLRDAMIFSAHVRERRDIFVTQDRKAFINHGRRDLLQSTFATRILLRVEFETLVAESNQASHLTIAEADKAPYL